MIEQPSQNSNSPQEIFSRVLLEKLLSPGVILDSLSRQPAEHIYFALAGIAFDRWLDANGFDESNELFLTFFEQIQSAKRSALRVIETQAELTSRCAHVH